MGTVENKKIKVGITIDQEGELVYIDCKSDGHENNFDRIIEVDKDKYNEWAKVFNLYGKTQNDIIREIELQTKIVLDF